MIRHLSTWIVLVLGMGALGWVIIPAVVDGRSPSPKVMAIAADGSTGALVASDQAASRLAPTGFDHTIAGDRK